MKSLVYAAEAKALHEQRDKMRRNTKVQDLKRGHANSFKTGEYEIA